MLNNRPGRMISGYVSKYKPGRTGIPQLFSDNRLLEAEVHEALHDGVGMWYIKADFREFIVDSLEALCENKHDPLNKIIPLQRLFKYGNK